MHQMTAEMDSLRNDHQVALSRLAELEGPDREAQIDELTEDINRILHAAHAAAQNLRERAATEVSAFVSTSTEEAQRKLRQAEDDAYALRKDAWETAETLLNDVVAHVQAVQTQAEKDALAIVGEAERTAHRKLSSANREAEALLKSARLEGEEIKVAALAERDALIEEARRSTTAAQERVRALEVRRDELLADINAQAVADTGTTAPQTATPQTGPEYPSTTIKVVRPGDPPSPPAKPWLPDGDADNIRVIQPSQSHAASWADGTENVRVVPGGSATPGTGKPHAPSDTLDLDGADIADEVRRLHGESSDPADAIDGSEVESATAAALESVGTHIPDADTRDTDGQSADVIDEPVAAPTAPPMRDEGHDAFEPEVTSPGPSDRAHEPTEPMRGTDAFEPLAEEDATPLVDELEDGPSTRLSTENAGDAPVRATQPEPAPVASEPMGRLGETSEIDQLFGRLREQSAPVIMPAAPAAAAPEETGTEISEDTPISDLVAPEAVEPFDERDRRLLPITNRVLRSIKRELSESQNVALEALRTEPDGWTPDGATFAAAVGPEFTILHNEAFAAGSAAAAAIVGQADPRPKPLAVPDDSVGGLVDELYSDVHQALEKGRTVGQGVRELSASVSRVYRAWRTDLAERRVRDLAGSAYHHGMRAAYADLGVEKVRLHILGAGCMDCRAAAEHPFGVGDWAADAPPFHAECTCTLLPN